jgi:hypothetical protein
MPHNWMPSWALKTKLLTGIVGGIASGVGGGVGWHFLAVHIDPPGIAMYAVEAVLVTVLIMLRRKPKTPHSPNFNLIPTLTRCPLA